MNVSLLLITIFSVDSQELNIFRRKGVGRVRKKSSSVWHTRTVSSESLAGKNSGGMILQLSIASPSFVNLKF